MIETNNPDNSFEKKAKSILKLIENWPEKPLR